MYSYSVDQVIDMAHRQVPRGAVPIGIVDLQSPLYVFPWSRLYGNLLLMGPDATYLRALCRAVKLSNPFAKLAASSPLPIDEVEYVPVWRMKEKITPWGLNSDTVYLMDAAAALDVDAKYVLTYGPDRRLSCIMVCNKPERYMGLLVTYNAFGYRIVCSCPDRDSSYVYSGMQGLDLHRMLPETHALIRYGEHCTYFERYYEEACFDNIYDMGW